MKRESGYYWCKVKEQNRDWEMFKYDAKRKVFKNPSYLELNEFHFEQISERIKTPDEHE